MNRQSGPAEQSFEALKAKQRAIRHGFPPDHGLRVHRALNWLHRAELAGDDHDAAFIFCWIAFNAAYAAALNAQRPPALRSMEGSAPMAVAPAARMRSSQLGIPVASG